MSMYCNRLQPPLQNLLQRVVWCFHPRSSCMTMHISADVQRIKLNATCMMISGERTKQLDIFCRLAGFTSDFLSFIVVDPLGDDPLATVRLWNLFGSFTEPFKCLLTYIGQTKSATKTYAQELTISRYWHKQKEENGQPL